MFEYVREKIIAFVTSRLVITSVVLVACACGLIYRLFTLQIVNGENYINSFQLIIKKEKEVSATRGCIYDRNGNILAYNELANSVTIEDVFKSGSGRNAAINSCINRTLDILEKTGMWLMKISLW